jgi:hypothetical protein
MEPFANPDLPSIPAYWRMQKPEGRFNDWGERKGLTAPTEKEEAVARELANLTMSPRALSLYQVAQLTDATGIEFVFTSDAEIPRPVFFKKSGIRIVPCFIPFRQQASKSGLYDQRHSAMMKRGQFIYDGWVENSEWTATRMEQIVSDLDDLTNLFSIVGQYRAYWEPKYYSVTNRAAVPVHFIEPNDFIPLVHTIGIVDSLPEVDRDALSRSTAWIADAMRDESPVKRFLLLFVSVEALATYIERKAKSTSQLYQFSTGKLSDTERREEREACIQSILAGETDLMEAVKQAYFDCVVGSRKMLEAHLNHVFKDKQISHMMFNEKIQGKTLWQLRNDIAHGTLNIANEQELSIYTDRVHTIEEIARSYVQTILTRLAGVNYFPVNRSPSLSFAAPHSIGTPNVQYMGPTDMAEYYVNVEALSFSFVRITS